MMNKRIEFNYYIGLKGGHAAFENLVIKEASRLAGGCTVTHSVGYWVKGADRAQERYAGSIENEFCFHLQFSVEPLRKMEINYTMRACIRQLARKYRVDIDWVHVTTHAVDEHHFQIKPGDSI